MSVHQYKNGTWYVKTWVPERQKYWTKTFGKGDENSSAHKQAVQFDKEVKAMKRLGKSVTRGSVFGAVLLGDIAQDFFADLKMRQAVKDYHRSWVNVLNTEVLPELGDIPVDAITAQDVRRVAQRFQSKGNSVATVNRYMGYLGQIFNHGVRMEMVSANPIRFWRKMPEPKPEVRLNVEDVRKIYAVSPDHLQWAMVVALNVIARVGEAELLALAWSDVDWERKTIRYYMPKVKKFKIVPCSDRFVEQLRQRREVAQSDHIVEFRGKPIKSFRSAWRIAVRNAGLDYYPRPYDLRHVAISDLLDREAPLAAVSHLAGHASTRTTFGRYYHSDTNSLRKIVDRVSDLAA